MLHPLQMSTFPTESVEMSTRVGFGPAGTGRPGSAPRGTEVLTNDPVFPSPVRPAHEVTASPRPHELNHHPNLIQA